jgi:hypothetical protein
MSDAPPFDLNVAESAAQVASIWFVLKVLTRATLNDLSPQERAAFLENMRQAAETITLPSIDDPNFRNANEWIAHRYWQLISEFVEQVSEQRWQGGHGRH